MILRASAIPVALRIRASLDVPRVCKRVCGSETGGTSAGLNRMGELTVTTHLGDVQWGGQCSRYTSRHTTSGDMGRRRVLASGVQERLQDLVYRELDGLQRNVHQEGRRVGNVERSETFGRVHVLGTGDDRAVSRVLELHTLFDDCRGERREETGKLVR